MARLQTIRRIKYLFLRVDPIVSNAGVGRETQAGPPKNANATRGILGCLQHDFLERPASERSAVNKFVQGFDVATMMLAVMERDRPGRDSRLERVPPIGQLGEDEDGFGLGHLHPKFPLMSYIRRPGREREALVTERTRITNRMKVDMARLGIRGFKRPIWVSSASAVRPARLLAPSCASTQRSRAAAQR
jgi:hypothetical protein